MNIGLNSKNLITTEELSNILNISKPSVYRLIDKRAMPFYKIGGSIRFSLVDIENYLSVSRVEPINKRYERL